MKIIFFIIIFTSFTTQLLFSATDSLKPMQYNFSFNGIFGGIDKNSAQRGLQVFTEVCASCHGLNHLAYRNLEDIGYNKTQINSIAKQFLIDDIPDENGEIKKETPFILINLSTHTLMKRLLKFLIMELILLI